MTSDNINITGKKIGSFLIDNIVPICFIIFVIVGFNASDGVTPSFFANEVITRFFRNGLLVLSLIIPVMAGLGLNFGIVIGALAAILALIPLRYFGASGLSGLMLAFLLALPIAILFGYLTGKLYNRTRGQEMIASLIVGFFAEGLFLIFVLFVIGGIIPVGTDHPMIIPGGVGVRATFDMGMHPDQVAGMIVPVEPGMRFALNWLWRVEFLHALIFLPALVIIFKVVRRIIVSRNPALPKAPIWAFVLGCLVYVALMGIGIYGMFNTESEIGIELSRMHQIPAVTGLVILGFCGLITYFRKTKLGQDCRSVGQSQHIAKISGIDVDRTRIIATIISTVLAAWGMIIFLQEVGTVSTYTHHRMIGMFSVAALLVGGATVTKASVKNAMLGLLLFHSMFIVSPGVGGLISNDVGVGEYTRSFMVYAVIGLSLGLHVWKTHKAAKDKDKLE